MKDYDVLVLSGGGVKGVMMIGALENLYQRGHLSRINTFAGTSVGAILSLLLCVGYTPKEIFVKMMTSRIFEVMAQIDILNLFRNKAPFNTDSLRALLEEMIHDKIGSLPTLHELIQRTNKEYVAVAWNMDSEECEYLSWRTRPDLGAVDAALMSASLPIIFPEFRYESQQFVDGGLADNFPIQHFDDGKKQILGIYIEPSTKLGSNYPFLNHLYTLFQIPTLIQLRWALSHKTDNVDALRLFTSNVHMIDFGLDRKKKFELYSSGYQQVIPQIHEKYD